MTTLEQQPTRPPHRAHRTPRRTPDAAGLRAAQPFTPSYRCSRCRAFALYSPFGKHALSSKVSLAALRPFRSSRRRAAAPPRHRAEHTRRLIFRSSLPPPHAAATPRSTRAQLDLPPVPRAAQAAALLRSVEVGSLPHTPPGVFTHTFGSSRGERRSPSPPPPPPPL